MEVFDVRITCVVMFLIFKHASLRTGRTADNHRGAALFDAAQVCDANTFNRITTAYTIIITLI